MKDETDALEVFRGVYTAAIVLSAGDTELASFALGFKEACFRLGHAVPKGVDESDVIAGVGVLLRMLEEGKRCSVTAAVETPDGWKLSKNLEKRGREVFKRVTEQE